MKTPDSNDLNQRYQALLASQKTLLLSTADVNGVPDCSYAPFVRDSDGIFYIYVSNMATHTGNLLSNPQASILFIRSEAESANLFARERAMLMCAVIEIGREEPGYADKVNALQEQFGEVIDMLRSLPDFHLFALQPITGRYVLGFGRAFAINGPDDCLVL